jgi:predicted porin
MKRTGKRIGLAGATALSMAVLSAGAFAQSNVTVYGLIDAGVEYNNNVPGAGGRPASVVREVSGASAASRWGFRAMEDLGGGLKAVFNLEGGFATDTGAMLQGGRLFGRMAYTGIEGSWGGVTLGRHRNTIYDLFLQYDPTSYATYGLTSMDTNFLGRADNSIRYAFKRDGLSAIALYSLGRDGTIINGSEVPGAAKVGREYSTGINYVTGPASIGVAFDQQYGTSIATQSDYDRRLAIGTKYALGKTKLFAGYQRRQTSTSGNDRKTNLYWLGAEQRITQPLSLTAGLFHTDPSGSPQSATLFTTSLTYSLSTRTNLYVNAAYAKNRGGSNLGVTGFGTVVAGENQTGVVSGIMHVF